MKKIAQEEDGACLLTLFSLSLLPHSPRITPIESLLVTVGSRLQQSWTACLVCAMTSFSSCPLGEQEVWTIKIWIHVTLVCTVGRPKGAGTTSEQETAQVVERYLCLVLLRLSLPPVSSTSMLATVNAEGLDHCLLHCVTVM